MTDEEFSKRRTELLNRWSSLQTERASWIEQWWELSQFILPSNGRFFLSDRNKGRKKFNNIYDPTATKALRTLGAGLMSGATSPARPWFRLQTPDPSLNAYQPVKIWLDEVSQLMQKVFQKSNTYGSLQQMYEELGTFGTAASIIQNDFESVIHHNTLTCGEYCISQDAQGRVCTLFRRFQMQVSAVVKEFGIENCSDNVQSLYRGSGLDQWIDIQHSIEPRWDRDPSKKDAKNMAWSSIYMEFASSRMLRESGYKRFPAVVPRWNLAGGDIYGTSPGMEALGDIKQLQHGTKRKAQGIDYQTNPPLAVPTSLRGQAIDRLPGGITYVDNLGGPAATVKNMFEVNLELQYLLQSNNEIKQSIRETFFADLFLMLSSQEDPRMTATEVAARQEEKMLMLGPVYERLSNELYTPMVNQTFDAMLEGGAIPPPPQELQGQELQVEYISVLAQAQRAIGVNSIDRFTNSLGVVAQLKPEVLDKFDPDAYVDVYSDSLGVDPSIIIASDKVAIIRQQRAQAQAAQQQAAALEQASSGIKNLGQTPVQGGGTAYDQLNNLTGYATPQ